MDLDTWLWSKRMTQKEFGEQLGLEQTRINLITRRRVMPKLPLAKKIVEATNGEVTYDDLIFVSTKKASKKKKSEL